MRYPDAIDKLIEALRKYPGVGKKTAERYALYTVNRLNKEAIDEIVDAYLRIKEDIFKCPICGNITDTDPCYICKDQSRDKSTIIVIEEAKDLIVMEKTNKYHIICADRDFNYDMIHHIVNFKLEYIVDITTLDNQDIQALCDLVNNSTFKNYNTKMSLFELTYYLWKGKRLSNKIKGLVHDLSMDTSRYYLYEFFTLMTYIRSSGISASMDMLLLYYTDNNEVNYNMIYKNHQYFDLG